MSVNIHWLMRVAHARRGRERQRWLSMTGEKKILWRLKCAGRYHKRMKAQGSVPDYVHRGPQLLHNGRKMCR